MSKMVDVTEDEKVVSKMVDVTEDEKAVPKMVDVTGDERVAPKMVEVTIHRIYCEDIGNDDGSNIEVRGTIWVGTGSTDHEMNLNREIMWRKEDDQGVNIGEHGAFIIERSVRLPLYPNQWLFFEAHLMEDDDTTPDDDLGWYYKSRPESNIQYNHVYSGSLGWFEFEGQKVRVEYSYRPVQ